MRAIDHDLDLYAPLAEPEPPAPRVCGTCAHLARLARLDGTDGRCCSLDDTRIEEVEDRSPACENWRD